MRASFGPAGLALGAAVAAWGTFGPAARPRGPSTDSLALTAFPSNHAPMTETGVADEKELLKRLRTGHPRPVPDAASPLEAVRLHQLNEGVAYILRAGLSARIAGCPPARDFPVTVTMIADTYRVAADLEPTAAGNLGLAEERVAVLKEMERVINRMVETATNPPQDANVIRFHRLQAEADLIRVQGAK